MLLSDLLYDVVLMRAEDGEQFAAYLYDWLTTDAQYNELKVFRYDDDVPIGGRQYTLLTGS